MNFNGYHELTLLKDATRYLAEAKTLQEVKSVRDKAEAARQYAKSAALGLELQNLAAELKLRAERKAGAILAQLSLRGGDRKSNSHNESLKLSDLGIDHNQSARWQQAAAISESVFLAYFGAAKKAGIAVTSHGLFRLASKDRTRRPRRSPIKAPVTSTIQKERAHPASSPDGDDCGVAMPNGTIADRAGRTHDPDILAELGNQTTLLATILTPFCEGQQAILESVCKRSVVRLLREMQETLSQLTEASD